VCGNFILTETSNDNILTSSFYESIMMNQLFQLMKEVFLMIAAQQLGVFHKWIEEKGSKIEIISFLLKDFA